ncbi:MAG: diguanylate cyclase [Kangiellaceae bacterium]|nr:diguanylate cyclase [Kangiellaceae bacterium]
MTTNWVNEKSILNSLNTGVLVHGGDGNVIYANPKAIRLLRLSEVQVYRQDQYPKSWRIINRYREKLAPEQYPASVVFRTSQPIKDKEYGISDETDEKVTWVLVNAYPEFDSDRKIKQVVVTFVDFSYQDKEIPFHEIVRYANDVIMVTDAQSKSVGGPFIVYVNEAFAKLSGYSTDFAIGKSPKFLHGANTDIEARNRIRSALDNHLPIKETIYNYRADKTGYWVELNIFPLKDETGVITHFAAIERDVTEKHSFEEELIEQAATDPLTNLHNRRGFFDGAKNLIRLAEHTKEHFAIALIDLDRFKQINDQFGHDIGDQYLIAFAERMKKSFRKTDLLARYGGEEFIILLPFSTAEDSMKVVEKFRRSLDDNPIMFSDFPKSSTTISVGMAVSERDSKEIHLLISAADRALYNAKDSGRNRLCLASKI